MNDGGDQAARLLALLAGLGPGVDLAARGREMAALYDGRSTGYDQRNRPETYLAPALALALARRHLPAGCGPVLDLACGTGLLGQALHQAGWRDLVGIDASPRMVQAASAKGVYRDLFVADLHAPLPVPPAGFAAVTCLGAFYEGIVELPALAHALTALAPGGWLICDVELPAWDQFGFRDGFARLAEAGVIALHTGPVVDLFAPDYVACPGRLIAAQKL